MIVIIAIRLSDGDNSPAHHAFVVDQPVNYETGACTRATIVKWIENEGGEAYVDEGGHRVTVYVRMPVSGSKYLQTATGGRWENTLLALPRK